MKKLFFLAIALIPGCIQPGARFAGMHNDRPMYEVYCPRDNRSACDQVSHHACKNADFRVVYRADDSATTHHFWLECEF